MHKNEEFFDKSNWNIFFLSYLLAADFIYGDWFQYERQYEQFAKTNNVMTLFYEDMKTVSLNGKNFNYVYFILVISTILSFLLPCYS